MRNLKKILALVLALAMSMSLVTIANAADFTDEKDISYEEAVDVMSAIGVIEGFEDGSFNPAGTLTREQAAAIICRMMLGDNADKLGSTSSSFKDVPASRWSAPYVGYCASLGIIAGNGDGTFNPTGTLTGYAFAKMLLGALGYKADVEGFVGAGWNLKVAAMASKAGLLNDLTGFVGSEAVTREVAAQMALNTVKATLVEYDGTTIDVSTGDANVSIGNTQYSYVTSNNGSINKNIDSTTQGNTAAYYTLEFGEQYFPNLKLVSTNTRDDFGRPANQWSLSNVTIGKYAKTPAFTYTTKVSTSSVENTILNALGLKGYKLASYVDNNNQVVKTVKAVINGKAEANALASVAAINGYTNYGTTVEVYTSETAADTITDVVVVQTQLMQVSSKSSSGKTVSLKSVDNTVNLTNTVNRVDEDNDTYETLAALDVDAYVMVTPLWNGSDYDVASVYVPTTASGNLSKVTTSSSLPGGISTITVDGTAYNMSANWTAENGRSNLNTSSVNNKVTSTVYLDAFGYVAYIEDVTASTNYILFDEWYTSLVDGKLIYMAQGYDMSGNELTLNVGTTQTAGLQAGHVYAYTVSTKATADYDINNAGVASVTTGVSNGATTLDGKYFDSSVKFIFLTGDGTYNNNGYDLTNITVKDGVQKVSAGVNTQYVTKKLSNGKDVITAVIVADDKDVEVGANVIYVSKIEGSTTDANGKTVSVFTAFIDGEKNEGLVADKVITPGFYTYAEADGIYTMKAYTNDSGKATSVLYNATLVKSDIVNDTYLNAVYGSVTATGLYAKNAVIIDLASGNNNFSSLYDLSHAAYNNYAVSIVYNDSDTAAKGTVSYIFVLDTTASKTVEDTNKDAITEAQKDFTFNGKVSYDADGNVILTGGSDYTSAKDGAVMKISADLARYLGGLYNTGAITIEYKGVTYTWNPAAAGNLQGSNWYGNGETLVKAITDDWKGVDEVWGGDNTNYSAQLFVNGVSMTYTAVVGA